jgi:hypothetical protein
MTSIQAQGGPKGRSPEQRQPQPDAEERDDANSEAETEEEKIKREQATNPALMPIGDPAGAA